MKIKLMMMALLMCFGFNSFGQNLKKLDEKNGFREVKFNTGIKSIPNLQFIGNGEPNIKFYKKTNEILMIGDYKLKSITYVFYKEILCGIIIETEGYSNSRGILDLIKSLYGDGYQSNEYIEQYYWFGDIVTLSYEENLITNDAAIIFKSKKIIEQQNEDKKEKAKKSGM